MDATLEQLEAINVGLELERKFEDADLVGTHGTLLLKVGREYVESYNGSFSYMADLHVKTFGGKSLSYSQLRGALNCLMAEWKRGEAAKVTALLNVNQPPTEWIGEIGERRTVLATVESIRWMFQDVYSKWRNIDVDGGGARDDAQITSIKFMDAEGHHFAWMASGPRDFTVGQVITLTGTITAHTEWSGVKETKLNRCRLGLPKSKTTAKAIKQSTTETMQIPAALAFRVK